MSYMPLRGGSRGGKDQFQWDDVKADKHRENYLGHSVMAPVGRWQKGKDLSWYSKKSKVLGQKEILKAEIAAVKRAEEEAMAAALGLKPKALTTGSVSKQELAEACRRQSVDEKEEEGQEERMTGLGFMKWSHRHSSQSAATGAAMFESRPVHEVESGPVAPPSLPPPSPSTTTATSVAASQHRTQEGLLVDKDKRSASRHGRGKDKKKKKRKKEKSRKKPKKERSRRNHRSSSSDSEEVTSRQRRKRDESSGDIRGR
ncbi:Multiple myeloma tumor-associated protein 2 homolog [Geodia barretti]|uniref:Multiple myeloma tumor-associated protein 2 homolog n=1 Tax=Geodia barretti TaxID=519541 RepID=A0AA35TPF3_GEOBA|nr:Multiple myeloma tumor-associated protein 2 homolog [Geodia barretti]